MIIILCLVVRTNSREDSIEAKNKKESVLEPITIDSHGSKLQGYFSQAKGEGPHPTLICLHGAPGGPKDVLGLAQNAPRAGWNALVFTFRGFWESEGRYTLTHSYEDVFSALKYLRSPEIVKKYQIDVNHIAITGFSFGGNIALIAAANDTSLRHSQQNHYSLLVAGRINNLLWRGTFCP
jgi:dienelactone hydrolase